MLVELGSQIRVVGNIDKCIGILLRAPVDILNKELIISELSAKGFNETNPDKPVLIIAMPCGESGEYWTYDDIPDVDVPCPCGNPSHWLIKYEML